jgi:hypothetical protein
MPLFIPSTTKKTTNEEEIKPHRLTLHRWNCFNRHDGGATIIYDLKQITVIEQVGIALKLYRSRDSIKRFYGDEFEKTIEPYKQCLAGYMQDHNCNEIGAVLGMCQDEVISKNGWTVMLIMAAGVEMVEPSNGAV